jgi:hypothetical protein
MTHQGLDIAAVPALILGQGGADGGASTLASTPRSGATQA